MCSLLRAVSGNLIQPIDDLALAAAAIDEGAQIVATTAWACHPHGIELANQIAEDDCVSWQIHATPVPCR